MNVPLHLLPLGIVLYQLTSITCITTPSSILTDTHVHSNAHNTDKASNNHNNHRRACIGRNPKPYSSYIQVCIEDDDYIVQDESLIFNSYLAIRGGDAKSDDDLQEEIEEETDDDEINDLESSIDQEVIESKNTSNLFLGKLGGGARIATRPLPSATFSNTTNNNNTPLIVETETFKTTTSTTNTTTTTTKESIDDNDNDSMSTRKQKIKPSRKTTQMQRGTLDTTQVATASSRLLIDELDEDDEEDEWEDIDTIDTTDIIENENEIIEEDGEMVFIEDYRIQEENLESEMEEVEELSQPVETGSEEEELMDVDVQPLNQDQATQPQIDTPKDSAYISSGVWGAIDTVTSFTLSNHYESLRLSRKLYTLRKKTANLTGLHGLLSGKSTPVETTTNDGMNNELSKELNEEDLGVIRRKIEAIELAKKRVAASRAAIKDKTTGPAGIDSLDKIPRWRRPFVRKRRLQQLQQERQLQQQQELQPQPETVQTYSLDPSNDRITEISRRLPEEEIIEQISPHELARREAAQALTLAEELQRKEQVKQIDLQIQEGQNRIVELQCQKDELQRRPNPFYNYTTDESAKETNLISEEQTTTRVFNFPSNEMVAEYIDELIANGRLQKLNHTELWRRERDSDDLDEDDDYIGDDLITPSKDAKKLYEQSGSRNGKKNKTSFNNELRNAAGKKGGGSWLLRQTLGQGMSLGEKIGETAETAAYAGVCSSIMSVLARSLAALHGVNVMTHSDIRLFIEDAPDLPPVSKNVFGASSNNDYAREVIGKAIRKGSKKKRRRKQKSYQFGQNLDDETFIQRDAVVETLISHCRISAPLLNLFPLAWQRAVLGNIITLIAAVVSDFCEGVQFQILGHQLSFAFKPITEADMIQHIGKGGFRFNHRRAKPEEFEAAVRATANDIFDSLVFLDRWHQRALGGDVLRAQIGNLIARLVLTLVDEVLHSARMDLWSAQVGGPRVVAGLEYRSEEKNTDKR